MIPNNSWLRTGIKLRIALANWRGGLVVLALIMFISGCDRSADQPVVPASSPAAERPVLPKPKAVVTDERIGREALAKDAASLLSLSQFDKLDALADSLRKSKESYSDGYWKLSILYEAISEPRKGASASAWPALFDQLNLWAKVRSNSITARVALAEAWSNYAWDARGSGYANTVSEKSREQFRDRLATSRKVLTEAAPAGKQCPRWFRVALKLGMGEAWPRAQYDEMFNEAIRSEPDFFGFYNAKVLYLLPRWFGGEGEWEKFAKEIADKRGGEKGDALYAQIIWQLQARVFRTVFGESKADWPRTKRGFEVLQKEFPDSLAATSQYCMLAGLAGDRATMKPLFLRIGERVDVTVWGSTDRFLEDREWAFRK